MLSLAVTSFPLAVSEKSFAYLVVGGILVVMIIMGIAKTIKQVNAFSQDHRHANYKVNDLV